MADFAALKIAVKVDDVEKAAKLLKELGVSADKAGTAVDEMGDKTKKSTTQIQTFQQTISKFSSGLRTFANNVNMYVMLPLIGIGTAAVKSSIELNRGLANVGTLIPGQTEQLLKYKEQIKDLAVETGKSFGDLTRGLYEVISAFPGTKDAIKITEVAAKTALGGLSTTKQALDLLSATTKAYGDTSAAAQQKVADLAFTAVKFGQTTFLEVSSAIQKVTASTMELGVSQEELFSVFSTFTGVTGDAEMVATQLRSALISLLNPTVELKNMFELMGYTGAKAGKELIGDKGLLGAFEAIAAKAEELDLPIQKYMRRIEGITFAQQLLGPLNEKFISDMGEMANAAGAQAEATEQITDGINKAGYSFDQFKMEVQGLLSELGDELAPMLVDLLRPLRDMVKNFSEASEETKNFIVSMGLGVVKLSLMLKVISLIITATKTLLPLFTSLAVQTGIAAGPLAALAGLVAAGGFTITVLAQTASAGRLSDSNPNLPKEFKDYDYSQLSTLQGAILAGEHNFFNMDFDTQVKDTVEWLNRLSVTVGVSREALVDYALQNKEVSGRYREVFENIKSVTDALQRQRDAQKEINNQWLDEKRFKSSQSTKDLSSFMTPIQQYDADMQIRIQNILDLEKKGTVEYEDSLKKLFAERQKAYTTFLDQVEKRSAQAGFLSMTDEEEEYLEKQLAAMQKLEEKMNKLGIVVPKPKEILDPWTEALKDYEKTIDIIQRKQEDGLIGQPEVINQVKAALEGLVNVGYDLGISAEEMAPYVNYLKDLMETQPGITKVAESMEDMLLRVKSELIKSSAAMGLHASKTEIYRVQMEGLANMIQEGLDSGKTLDELDHLTKKMIEVREEFTWSDILDQIVNIFGSQLPDAFNKIGRALADSTNAMEGFKDALANTMLTVAEAIPGLMIQAGLQMLIESGGKRGWSLLAAGLAGEVGIGWAQQDRENRQESNAKGGVYGYANGGAFTNSIVNTPTKFAFANGVGLMGEAGPEAIMPLSRTQDGRLGVAASGGSEKDVIVNIINQANNSEVETRERETSTGKEIDVIIKSKVSQIIANGGADGAMRSRYGVSPRGYR